MTRACAVSIMNACLHELVWMLRASSELAWRLASTAQQQWCMSYEPGACCCSHPSSARERLLYRRWLGTSCSPARRRFETALAAIPRQRRDRGIAGVYACSGRTVASASVPRRGTGTNRCFFPVHSHLRLDPATCRSIRQCSMQRANRRRARGRGWAGRAQQVGQHLWPLAFGGKTSCRTGVDTEAAACLSAV